MPEVSIEPSSPSRAGSFRFRVAIAIVLLVSVTLSVAAIAMWGVVRIHEDSQVALRGYRQLRDVYEVGVYVTQARQSLRREIPDVTGAQRNAAFALDRLDQFTGNNGGWLAESMTLQEALRSDLASASGDIDGTTRTESLDRAMSRLSTLASQVRSTIETHESAAQHERHVTLLLIAVFSLGFLMLAGAIGVLHYRSIVRPIDLLAQSVRMLASGRLDTRVNVSADREFAQLAADLNFMASELQSLYDELERKVDEKSRELVRSERLASVGYLAAGVAHEINNPLGIIAAYAERALQRLRRGDVDASNIENAQRAFEIICDEAFRCKQITDRLLSMARAGDEVRKPVSVSALVQEVVATLVALPQFAGVNLTLKCEEDTAKLMANVNDAEIKQVVLNLLVNAVEAIDTRGGRIDVSVSERNGSAELIVTDNGQGMETETLQRVFEPFFSQKRPQRHGTGLGLSICHAIIESHGGRLSAASDGVGKGSRFTVTLPLAKEANVASV